MTSTNSYYAVGLKSEKTVKPRKLEAEEPMDYTHFYTNLHPEEVPPEELVEAYRRRRGIETDSRVIKEEFLAKSASRNPRFGRSTPTSRPTSATSGR